MHTQVSPGQVAWLPPTSQCLLEAAVWLSGRLASPDPAWLCSYRVTLVCYVPCSQVCRRRRPKP